MAKTKQELEKEFEAYKAAAEEREKKLKKRLLAGEKSNSEAIRTLYDKHEKAVKENEELKEMLDKRNKDYMDLSLEYNNLELTIENKNEAYKKLEKSCIKYQSQIKESEEDYEALNKEFYDLLEKYEELSTAHSNMSKRYGCLVCDNEYLKRENKDLKKELEEEKAKSKFIPLPSRPDYPALLKRYTDLQKDHEQLDKDFKDLYGRYEEQKKRIAELVSLVDDKYDTIWNLKTELEAKQYYIEKLEAQTVFEEIFFGKTDITIEDVMDILNAWFVLNDNRLVDISSCIFIDGIKTPRHEIVIYNRIDSTKDPKEFEIVKKAMGIKSCQSE